MSTTDSSPPAEPPRGATPAASTPAGGIANLDWQAVEADPDFQELRRRLRAFVFPVTGLFLSWYVLYVLVATFAPGFMETEATLARDDWQSGRREQLINATPAGRIPPPEDLAGAALFLATPEADHLVGAYVIADGGYSTIGA